MRRMIIGIVAMAFGLTLAGAAAGQPQRTIEDLKTAYRVATSAALRYGADARQAQKEGQKEAALLFRAVCQSEIVHARDYVDLLAKLGVARPETGAYTAVPGTTQANLADALRQETASRDELLPRVIEDAKAERQSNVELMAGRILKATEQHVKLYAAAAGDREQAQGSPYYICPLCGGIFARTAPARTPTCGTPREKLLVFK